MEYSSSFQIDMTAGFDGNPLTERLESEKIEVCIWYCYVFYPFSALVCYVNEYDALVSPLFESTLSYWNTL